MPRFMGTNLRKHIFFKYGVRCLDSLNTIRDVRVIGNYIGPHWSKKDPKARLIFFGRVLGSGGLLGPSGAFLGFAVVTQNAKALVQDPTSY